MWELKFREKKIIINITIFAYCSNGCYIIYYRLKRGEAQEVEKRTGIPVAEGILPLVGHLPQIFKLVTN